MLTVTESVTAIVIVEVKSLVILHASSDTHYSAQHHTLQHDILYYISYYTKSHSIPQH